MSIYGEYKNTTISEILETSGGRGSRRTVSVTTGPTVAGRCCSKLIKTSPIS